MTMNMTMRMTRHVAHGILAVLTLAATTTRAATINVSGGGSALQTAIGNANPGDILLVAPGTYSPITTDNKAITIESTGGASVTLIDGGGASRCATLGGDWDKVNTILTGFTLTNGWTTGYGGGSHGGTLNNCILTGNTATGTYSYGGGSYGGTLTDCTLTGNTAAYRGGGAVNSILNNCTLTGNTATEDGGGSCYGTLTDCTLTGNTAWTGGGSYWGDLNNCTLTGNTAWTGGGSYDCTLTDCTLTGNTADWNGGGSCYGTLNNCTLTGNTAYYYGGGSCYGTLTDCTLTGNTTYVGGGGSYEGTLNNCTLTGNTATHGGGSYGGTLNNCLLTGNTVDYRGGGSYYGTLNNCTLTGNTAGDGGGSFGGTLNNCTLANNTAAGGGGSFNGELNNCIVWGNSLTGSGASTNHYNSTFSYSCTAPLPSGSYDGGGNKEDDPLFVDAANGNYRLKPNSPCIDQGNQAYVTGDFDLDGNPRIWNGKVGMGAFEWTPTPIPMVYALNFGAWLNHHGLGHSPENWGKWLTFPDPLSPHTRPTATIEMKQGVPFVSWTPDLRPFSLRTYTVEMTENLRGPWVLAPNDLSTLPPAPARFFKVKVHLP